MEIQLSPILISSAVGLIISIMLEIVPGMREWWAGKGSQWKSLIILLLMVFVGAIVFLLSCYSPYTYVECSNFGVWSVVNVVAGAMMAYIASQAGHNGAKWFGPSE